MEEINVTLQPLPQTLHGREGVIKFFGRTTQPSNDTAAPPPQVKQIWESKPSNEATYLAGIRKHVQWDHLSNPHFVDATFSRPSKRARLDEKKIQAANQRTVVLGVGTALEHVHAEEEMDEGTAPTITSTTPTTSTATPAPPRPLTAEKDFHQPLMDINAAIHELNYIGHLANYVEGGNRLGDAIIGVKKLHPTPVHPDAKGTALAIQMANKQQQLLTASLQFDAATDSLKAGRTVNARYVV